MLYENTDVITLEVDFLGQCTKLIVNCRTWCYHIFSIGIQNFSESSICCPHFWTIVRLCSSSFIQYVFLIRLEFELGYLDQGSQIRIILYLFVFDCHTASHYYLVLLMQNSIIFIKLSLRFNRIFNRLDPNRNSFIFHLQTTIHFFDKIKLLQKY